MFFKELGWIDKKEQTNNLGKCKIENQAITFEKIMPIELIPSATRLINSLRDLGYEFEDAIADIVDNSIEAQATVIRINFKFDGLSSFVTIFDNGTGMTGQEIQKSLRFGSDRKYSKNNDLGRYGLGLKTASLSQARKLTVSSRKSQQKFSVNSFCWDLDYIEKNNTWEILSINKAALKEEVIAHLRETVGTVIIWENLDRLFNYKYPEGESAKKYVIQTSEKLKSHLGMVFHKHLSGEIKDKRVAIYINDEKIKAWDPYSRLESNTISLESISIPIEFNGLSSAIQIYPFILPPQSLFSNVSEHLKASGPNKWNKQQGLYIYRAKRIIQAGGWCGMRTNDEHSKLIRIAVDLPIELEELFQVNVAKKQVTIPTEIKQKILEKLSFSIHMAQEYYAKKEKFNKFENLEIKEKRSEFRTRIGAKDTERRNKLASMKKIFVQQKIFEQMDEELIKEIIRHLQRKLKGYDSINLN
jgi:hypothetical protein